jgi:hypothetical protein
LESVEQTPSTPQTPSGYGIGAVSPDYISQLGYVHKDLMQAQLGAIQAQSDMNMEKLVHQFRTEAKEADYQRKCEALDKREKELEEREKEVDSQSAKTGKLLGSIVAEAGKKLYPYFVEKTGIGKAEPSNEEEPDEMQKEAQAIAMTIYNGYTELSKMEQLHEYIKNLIETE